MSLQSYGMNRELQRSSYFRYESQKPEKGSKPHNERAKRMADKKPAYAKVLW